jgi:hypothetical protein
VNFAVHKNIKTFESSLQGVEDPDLPGSGFAWIRICLDPEHFAGFIFLSPLSSVLFYIFPCFLLLFSSFSPK